MSQFCIIITHENYTDYQEFYLDLIPELEITNKNLLIDFLVEIKIRQNNPEFNITAYREQLETYTLEQLLVPPIYPVVTISTTPEFPFRYNITAVNYAVDTENNRVTKTEIWTPKSPERIEEDLGKLKVELVISIMKQMEEFKNVSNLNFLLVKI